MRLINLVSTLMLTGCMTSTQIQSTDAQQRSEARIELGIGYMQRGDMRKARENLEQALKHSPNYYRAQLSIAHYYEQVGETQSAVSFYKKALKRHPNNGNVLNNYGTFLCKQGEFTIADRYFNQAIQQQNYYLTSTSYENAALCAMKAQQTEQAISYFKRALDFEPDRVRSALTLAELEVKVGSLEDARLRLVRFHHKFGPRKPSLRLLIELEQKAGNPTLAEEYKRKLDGLS
ncbi:type IV pilus biogenesis/stability protein PilW [Vibrio europaeus]|uniref:type IV pilus biogenesis/stability protein PilW n=1 Tax=Vibrio europaeus TaxID=300876 RepID=UPI00233ECF92|nr:type IV pilus biogenesis/stability protein PilW [Vibrio europaeus]MDC5820020.1 type IV pilus biogenesis/stability protein PilW [Vibrio europaeus]MDC5868929.1 type IV pilus biogenesis/stability protein PilW [Vibrio europaeus]